MKFRNFWRKHVFRLTPVYNSIAFATKVRLPATCSDVCATTINHSPHAWDGGMMLDPPVVDPGVPGLWF